MSTTKANKWDFLVLPDPPKSLFSFDSKLFALYNAQSPKLSILLPDQVPYINLCPPTEITEFLVNQVKEKIKVFNH